MSLALPFARLGSNRRTTPAAPLRFPGRKRPARARTPASRTGYHAAVLSRFWLSVAVGLALVGSLPSCAGQADTLGQATLLVDRGRYADAEAVLQKRLRSHPDDNEARRLLVRVLGAKGDLGRSEREAEALSVRLGPKSPVPWVELGFALELAHRYDEALSLYEREAATAPANPLGPKTGGLRAARWGERELARPRLEEALRRDSRDAAVWHALGLVCLGLGDLPSAEHAYRSGLVADPRALENHVGLATLALVEERPAAALQEYDAILAARPKHGDALLGRSLAVLELDRLDDAERSLKEAEARGADPAVVAKQRRLLAAARAGLPTTSAANARAPSAPAPSVSVPSAPAPSTTATVSPPTP